MKAERQAALEGFTKESFEADGKRRDVYRIGRGPRGDRDQRDPGHHARGWPSSAAAWRRRGAPRCCRACSASRAARHRAAYALQSIGPACISREFSAFALKKTSPVTVWLRKLAAAEHERCGGPGVGVVGMCFTGGFALAMMVDDVVLAPVLSQPSLPFPLSKKYKADIGISDADLARVKERTGRGRLPARACASPTTRSASRSASRPCAASSATRSSRWRSTRRRATPTGTRRSAHSVLTEHLVDQEGTPTRAALDQTLTFFREKLGVGSGPGPRPDGMGP